MRNIICFALGFGIGGYVAYTIAKYFQAPNSNVDKYRSYYNMLNKWLQQEDVGKTVDVLLEQRGYKHIAIYGIGNMGERLNRCLSNTAIKVNYVIDSNSLDSETGLPVYSPEDELPLVDAIIVTVPFAYISIKEKLEKRTDIPVLSLEHVLFEV